METVKLMEGEISAKRLLVNRFSEILCDTDVDSPTFAQLEEKIKELEEKIKELKAEIDELKNNK